jgi:hypothetical protein
MARSWSRTGLQFSSQHSNRLGRFDSDLDSVALDRRDDDYDVSRNPNLFSDLLGKNQHQSILLRRTPGTLESRPMTLVLANRICRSISDISFNRIEQKPGGDQAQQGRKTADNENHPVIHDAVLYRW